MLLIPYPLLLIATAAHAFVSCWRQDPYGSSTLKQIESQREEYGRRSPTVIIWMEVFKAEGDRPPAQILIDQIDTIDMHHGVYYADPAYTVVRVIGTELVPEIRAVLGRFGFDSFMAIESGFEAVRPLPNPLGT